MTANLVADERERDHYRSNRRPVEEQARGMAKCHTCPADRQQAAGSGGLRLVLSAWLIKERHP